MKQINQLTLILAASLLLFIMFFASGAVGVAPMLILLIISFLISLVSLFLIHHRTLQMRLCIYNSIILIALQVWILVSLSPLKLCDVFPVIAAILTVVAITMIRRDEATSRLVKTLKKYKKNHRGRNESPRK